MTCWVKQNKWLFLKVHHLHQKLIPAPFNAESKKNYVIKSQRKKAQ